MRSIITTCAFAHQHVHNLHQCKMNAALQTASPHPDQSATHTRAPGAADSQGCATTEARPNPRPPQTALLNARALRGEHVLCHCTCFVGRAADQPPARAELWVVTPNEVGREPPSCTCARNMHMQSRADGQNAYSHHLVSLTTRARTHTHTLAPSRRAGPDTGTHPYTWVAAA